MSGFWGMIETDLGSKGRAKRAAEGLPIEISKETKWRLRAWWERVKETAKSLCVGYGAFETGTLYRSIRIEKKFVSVGGAPTFMVTFSPEHELIDAQIVAGGLLINPNTGRVCDYAESVHDGTGRNIKKGERPFLRDAINIHINELNKILNEGIDKALNTVWVGE